MQVAITASSFRAGMMAETVTGEDAGMKAPWAETFCSPVDIVYWMRKSRFATQVDCASIAFDGNPQKNGGLGSGKCGGVGCGVFFPSFLPPKPSPPPPPKGPRPSAGDGTGAG